MQLSHFHYELPSELIARYPLKKRSSSRLLTFDSQTGGVIHRQFTDFVSLISPSDLLVFNNTRVIAARLFGQKESGGRIEVLVERILDAHRVMAHVRASKTPKVGSYLLCHSNVRFEVLGRQADLFELRCADERPVLEVIEAIGQIPLPPYFHRAPDDNDQERYQTIYAEHKGSVAAPTAGLHFDQDIWQALREKNIEMGFVTLHVGAGTFAPVRVQDIKQHHMHTEYVDVSPVLCEQVKKTQERGGRVIAVGTTSARSLETASQSGVIQPFQGDTSIFIYPGYVFQCVDALLTNFHLPESTLLMLVAALGGYDNVMRAYQEAIAEKYRFFSYGDAMFVF